MRDGRLFLWGYNGDCMLGVGDGQQRRLPQPSVLTSDPSRTVRSVGIGYHDTAVVLSDGHVHTVGYNGNYQLGNGNSNNKCFWQGPLSGIERAVQVFVGGWTSAVNYMVLDEDGYLYCWGYNGYGQLGQGGTAQRVTPERVQTDSGYLTNVTIVKIHGSEVSTSFAITGDNYLYSWGYSGHYQTAYNNGNNRVRAGWAQYPGGNPINDAKNVFPNKGCRYGSICMINLQNKAYCWGYNNYGQVGDGSTSTRGYATAVSTIANVAWIENAPMVDHSYSYHSVCARLYDGTVWCWGFNNNGQLGIGDSGTRYSPVRVLHLEKVDRIYSRAYHASNGDTTFYAIADDERAVWGWGYSGHGQVGNNIEYQSYNPVPLRTRLW